MHQPDAADGSLTLYVQKDSPGANKESDWLPARNGPIYMVCTSSYFERGAGDGPTKNRKKWESGGNTSRVLSGRNPAS